MANEKPFGVKNVIIGSEFGKNLPILQREIQATQFIM